MDGPYPPQFHTLFRPVHQKFTYKKSLLRILHPNIAFHIPPCKLIILLVNYLKKCILIFYSLSYNFTTFRNSRFTIIFLFNRSSRMQKRIAWQRADYLINKPRFKRIGKLIKSWTRVGLKRVGKSDDQILCSIAKRITLQFWGSPVVDRNFCVYISWTQLSLC